MKCCVTATHFTQNMHQLIVNNVYNLRRYDIVLNVGMDAAKEYRSRILISQHSEPANTVILEEKDFFQLLQLAVKLTLVNADDDVLNEGTQSTNEISGNGESDMEIGNYIVRVLYPYEIIRFTRQFYPFLPISNQVLDLSLDCLSEIFNLNIAIRYKLKLLQIYKPYAMYTHKRIVNYTMQLFAVDENSVNYFSSLQMESFKLFLISLPEKSLPRLILEQTRAERYDTYICEVIDSEIRAIAVQEIFNDVLKGFSVSLPLMSTDICT